MKKIYFLSKLLIIYFKLNKKGSSNGSAIYDNTHHTLYLIEIISPSTNSFYKLKNTCTFQFINNL